MMGLGLINTHFLMRTNLSYVKHSKDTFCPTQDPESKVHWPKRDVATKVKLATNI